MSLYEVLKASKTERFPDYWTLLWGRKLSASMIKTITGTLPLTFRSNGNDLLNYRIYGTADGAGVQTENEFDYITAQILNCYVSTNGTITYSAYDRGVIVPVQPSTTYTLVMKRYAKEGERVDDVSAVATTTLPERGTQGRMLFYAVYGDILQTFTTDADEYFVYFKFCNTIKSHLDEQLQSIMLIKGSIAPTSHIPYGYKLPLTVESGETENLFDENTVTRDQSINHETGNTFSSQSSYLSDYIDINDAVALSILISNVSGTIASQANRGWCYFDAQQNFISGITWIGRTFTSVTFTVNSVPENAKYLRFSFDKNIDAITLVKGSTPPDHYIPHRYTSDIPIYIGDSKLLSSDYIDYESGKIVRDGTPQDPPLPLPAIETFKGKNTLDSTETLGEVTIKGQIKPQS